MQEQNLASLNTIKTIIASHHIQHRTDYLLVTYVLAYYEAGETLLVGYDDGDFDLFKKNRTINLPYIKWLIFYLARQSATFC